MKAPEGLLLLHGVKSVGKDPHGTRKAHRNPEEHVWKTKCILPETLITRAWPFRKEVPREAVYVEQSQLLLWKGSLQSKMSVCSVLDMYVTLTQFLIINGIWVLGLLTNRLILRIIMHKPWNQTTWACILVLWGID